MKNLILLVAALCFWSSLARADEPTEAERAAARELVWEGDQFFEQRQYERALSNYNSAYRLVRAPTVGIGITKSLAALGRLREALASAEEVAALPSQAGEHPAFAEARSEAKGLANELVKRVPVVELVIQPKLPDVEVRIDGAPLRKGSGSGYWRLDPGKHTIQVSAPGYVPKTREIELAERAQQRLEFALSPIAPPRAPVAATAPPPPAPVASESATASPPDAESAESRAASARTRAYVALGIAGAAVVANTVTGILAFQTKPDCQADECDPSYQDELDDSLLYGNIANVSFGVAVVAGIYGLYEYFANGRVETPEPANTSVSIAPYGAGVSLSGAF